MKILYIIIFVFAFCMPSFAELTIEDAEKAYKAKDYPKAIKIFSDLCAKDDAMGCGMLGRIYSEGLGGKHNISKATEFYAKAVKLFSELCENGENEACSIIAEGYKAGVDGVIEKDIQKTIEFYTKACENGYAKACYHLGNEYINGQSLEKMFLWLLNYIQ